MVMFKQGVWSLVQETHAMCIRWFKENQNFAHVFTRGLVTMTDSVNL